MAETHVISTLRTKRAEIGGYIQDPEKKIKRLRANLAHVDATIRLFAPGLDPDAIPQADLPANALFRQRRVVASVSGCTPRCPRLPYNG
jgi:hypothetical protein